MIRRILSFGAVAGLIVGIPLFGISVAWSGHPDSPWGAVIGYLTMLVAFSTVFVAIKRQRDAELGGVIGFWRATLLGVGISLVASLFYVLAWEAALAVTHMDFAGEYSRSLIEQKKAAGVTGPALDAFVAQMEVFRVQYANPLYRIPMTIAEILPVGVLVTLVSAGLLRNHRFLPAQRAG